MTSQSLLPNKACSLIQTIPIVTFWEYENSLLGDIDLLVGQGPPVWNIYTLPSVACVVWSASPVTGPATMGRARNAARLGLLQAAACQDGMEGFVPGSWLVKLTTGVNPRFKDRFVM